MSNLTAANVANRRLTTDEWASEIGISLRRRRLDAGLTQQELARLAAISVGAVKGLESGKGSTLRSLIRVSRVLHCEQWMDLLVFLPQPSVSPMQLLREQQSTPPMRRRAPRRRN